MTDLRRPARTGTIVLEVDAFPTKLFVRNARCSLVRGGAAPGPTRIGKAESRSAEAPGAVRAP